MALTISEREKIVENFHEYYPFAPQKSKNWIHKVYKISEKRNVIFQNDRIDMTKTAKKFGFLTF